MFKKLAIAGVVAALALGAFVPANAKVLRRKTITFSATPCAALCAYWVNPAFAPKAPSDPTNYDPTELLDAVDVAVAPTEAGCTHPGPQGSYDDVIVTAPLRAELLRFEAWPEVDWDLFICAVPAKGKVGSRYITYGANEISEESITEESDLCAVGIGCYERADIVVKPGRRYLLRAYNWSDPADLRARFTFFS